MGIQGWGYGKKVPVYGNWRLWIWEQGTHLWARAHERLYPVLWQGEGGAG